MKRVDIHRPSAIVPSEYEWVAFEHVPGGVQDLGSAQWQLAERARIRAHMERTGGTYSKHYHGGNCMVCGNVLALYTVLFYHPATNSYIRMGQDCAAKCDMNYDELAFAHWKKRLQDERKLRAGKNKAKALLTDNGVFAAWGVYEDVLAFDAKRKVEIEAWHKAHPGEAGAAEHSEAELKARGYPMWKTWPFEESTIVDIVGKLIRYGSASEKQFKFLGSLVDRIAKRDETAAKRKAETEAAAPIPEDVVNGDRVVIEGEVLTTKWVETNYGGFLKMLVKVDAGWKVWGTVPSGADVKRGDRIKIRARVERSKDDPKFGFFSRPALIREMRGVNNG